jgi:hypothetical protein
MAVKNGGIRFVEFTKVGGMPTALKVKGSVKKLTHLGHRFAANHGGFVRASRFIIGSQDSQSPHKPTSLRRPISPVASSIVRVFIVKGNKTGATTIVIEGDKNNW